MKIYFLRHAESEANVKRIFCHRERDCFYDLTRKGRKQAFHFLKEAERINFHIVYTSPLMRAVKTAEIISENKKIDCEITDALYEFDMGVLEGECDKACWLEYRDILKEWLIDRLWDNRVQGGESFNDMLKRFLPFIKAIKKKYSKMSVNILVIGHGGLYRCMLPYILSNIDYRYTYNNNLSYCEHVIAELRDRELVCLKWGRHILYQ